MKDILAQESLIIFAEAGLSRNGLLDCWEFTFERSASSSSSAFDPRSVLKTESAQADAVASKSKRHHKKRKTKKSVRWGEVVEISFSRSIGFVAVPQDGVFPLGLGEKVGETRYPIQAAQEERTLRSTKLFQRHASHSPVDADRPPFQALGEKERIALLVKAMPVSPSASREAKEHHREIKAIQQSRVHVGCNCRPLRPDKLNMAKLKEEVSMRAASDITGAYCFSGEDLDKMKKSDLVMHLKALVKGCEICTAAGCDCAKWEIPCSRSCHCQGRVRSSSDLESEYSYCGNPHGSDIFDADKVQDYRRSLLSLSAKQGDFFVCSDAM
eukprot:gene7958-8778_t